MTFDELQLTICSVSFHSKTYLEWNRRLANRLNPSGQLKWIIAQNTPPEFGEEINISANNCQIIEGAKFDPDTRAPAAYHHGSSLNEAISLVNTRFVLVLDPDFYIVRRQWANEVMRYMDVNHLAFLGVPWHPKWHYKYRYFPCVHCLFIDLAKVSRTELDFRPDHRDASSTGLNVAIPKQSRYAQLFSKISNSWQIRRGIGTSRDTGYKIYSRFRSNARIRAECFTPVYRVHVDYQAKPQWLNRFLDSLLPDHLSYIPKRKGYYTDIGFKELGFADTTQYGWEEFIWQREPFGFHLRSVMNRILGLKETLEQETASLINALADLTGISLS